MNKSLYLQLLAALCVHPGSGKAAPAKNEVTDRNAEKPNVILILVDDMGYSDLGCYGGELNTPALDSLAAEGLRLTQFRNNAMSVCSRMSLLTGKWWPQATRTFARTPLLSERMRQAGYRTALIGKWHLPDHPMKRGFDHFFGFLGGFSSHAFGSKDYYLDNERFTDFPPGYYSTDAFSDRAVDFIRKSVSSEDGAPFFIYLSYQAPHNPLQAPEGDIMRHRGHYSAGWQSVREARFARQKDLGLLPQNAELPPCPENLPDWDSLTPEQKDLEDLRMSVYAAMVERVDRGVSRIVRSLRDCGADRNTVILFLSDNGADSFSNTDDAMLRNGLLPGDLKPGSNWQLGTGWAYAAVTPWRLYKISQHGGGVTSGAILWAPEMLRREERIDHTALHMVDIVPTFSEMAGAAKPDSVDGESFTALFHKTWHRRTPMFFQFMDNRAIRTDRWTLVEVDDAGWELYDIRKDPLECCDLASQRPDVVRELAQAWTDWWQKQTGKEYVPSLTTANPHYKPQGDRGSGRLYVPRAMPEQLKERYAK